jgi:hypothetical protein
MSERVMSERGDVRGARCERGVMSEWHDVREGGATLRLLSGRFSSKM